MSTSDEAAPEAREWLRLLADCAQTLREGYIQHARVLANRAGEIEAAYPATIMVEKDRASGKR